MKKNKHLKQTPHQQPDASADFEPIIKAILGNDASCAKKRAGFMHRNACNGIGKESFFHIRDKQTKKMTQEKFCCIEVDAIWEHGDRMGGKCDYVFIRIEHLHYYFVELKGICNFEKAYNQICNTIGVFKSRLSDQQWKFLKKHIWGFVSGGSPRTTDIVQKYKEDFKKNYGTSFEKTREHHI